MKINRKKVFDKFGGRCAYCGCELEKGWHVDHIWPQCGSCAPDNSIENLNPACASCNINKRHQDLETFREMISHFITTLNRDSVQYRFAKKYGLVKETDSNVVFYFELQQGAAAQQKGGDVT